MSLDDLDAILVPVAREHGVRPMRIIAGGRCQPIQRIKRQAIHEMREAGGSLPKIARICGYRHHQPVMHALKVYAREHTTKGANP